MKVDYVSCAVFTILIELGQFQSLITILAGINVQFKHFLPSPWNFRARRKQEKKKPI